MNLFKLSHDEKLHISIKSLFYILVGCFLSFLSATNFYSRIKPDFAYTDYGYSSSEYSAQINGYDKNFNLLTKRDFIYFLVEKFPSDMQWGKQIQVSFLDNWILASTRWIDPILISINLQKDGATAFKYFQSHKYSRGLSQRSGFCSQLSYTLADLLYSRYGIKARMVGLDGHVVVSIILDDQSELIADPSLGIIFPFSINDVDYHLDLIDKVYESKEKKYLSRYYSTPNFIQSNFGAFPYYDHEFRGHMLMAFERISDFLSILLPLFLALISFLIAAKKYIGKHS